jgi:HAD superfamily hydrolase (TIGR01549 family)
MAIRAVFFDVGETLIDETQMWHGWARYLGVPLEVFLSVLDEVIEAGEHHYRAFERLRPDFHIETARRERTLRGDMDRFAPEDLYPDAAPCLQALRQQGLVIGIAGNQPTWAVGALRALRIEADLIASSAEWGIAKPDPAFFQRIVQACALDPAEIAYVGDRLDNDILPARSVGMVTVFLERGPWGRIHARRPEVQSADLHLTALADLPAALVQINGAGFR